MTEATETAVAELKPCPFCGYPLTNDEGICDTAIDEFGDVIEEKVISGVCCPGCGCFLPLNDQPREDAIAAWNRRTDTAVVGEEAKPVNVDALVNEVEAKAERLFRDYFVKNYPGPETIIGDPHWHSPKVFRAALHAIRGAEREAGLDVAPAATRSPTGGREAGLEEADRIVREEWNAWAKTTGVSAEALVACILNRILALPSEQKARS